MSSNAASRVQLAHQIKSCRRCPLAELEFCSGPVPPRWDRSPVDVLFVQGQVGKDENQAGKMGVGGDWRVIRMLVEKVGMGEMGIGFASVVSCASELPPRKEQVQSCRVNLVNTIWTLKPTCIVWLGREGLNAWRDDLTVKYAHGKFGCWFDTIPCMGIHLPSVKSQGIDKLQEELVEDLTKVRDCLVYGMEWGSFPFEECAKCGERSELRDRDGVVYCDRHMRKWGKEWQRNRNQQKRWMEVEQGRLELGNV